jgi:hypothetical protein
MRDNIAQYWGSEIAINGATAKIYRARVPSVKQIAPHQLQVTRRNEIVGFTGWEYMGRIETTTGRIFSRYDGPNILSSDVEQLVGIISFSTQQEDYGTKAIVFRIPFVGSGAHNKDLPQYKFTLRDVPEKVTGYRVGIVNETFQDPTFSIPEGTVGLWEEGHESSYNGRRCLGLVSNGGGAFVDTASTQASLVRCGYIEPAIDVRLMAGAAMLQIFGTLMDPWR